MRGLRSRSGLSLKELGAQTPYSKSSWERYLNGKTHPPRGAVVSLCRLARQPPAHPLALWERAETARNRPPRPAAPVPAPELTAVPEPVSVREGSSPPEPLDPRPAAARRHVRTGAVLAAALLCAAWLVMADPWRSERADADVPASSSPSSPVTASGVRAGTSSPPVAACTPTWSAPTGPPPASGSTCGTKPGAVRAGRGSGGSASGTSSPSPWRAGSRRHSPCRTSTRRDPPPHAHGRHGQPGRPARLRQPRPGRAPAAVLSGRAAEPLSRGVRARAVSPAPDPAPPSGRSGGRPSRCRS
nr:helix-turn-helix transcriptional regulator [Streptomyces sp. SID5594]